MVTASFAKACRENSCSLVGGETAEMPGMYPDGEYDLAATIVGGTSLSGGEGTIIGTILGVLIIGVLRNGLVLTGVSPFVQEFLIGLVIVVAVAIDKWTSAGRRA